MPNLARLNEQDEESDRTGVFNILGIFENILSFIPPLAVQVANSTELLPWLLQRIGKDRAYDSNKQYASEILSILLQEEREVRLKFVELGGLDVVLEAVAVSLHYSLSGRNADLNESRRTARKTPPIPRKSNSWKTYSTRSARP